MTETATFGAGCFWGVEWVFRKVPGVLDAVSGYSGGATADPTYREVCSHTTGHAEVVQVTFDPSVVTYDQLLEVFWAMHDPTQVDRQGPDVGDQYRSVIFAHTPEQLLAATESRAKAQVALPATDRDRDPDAHGLLPGRGLPPALLRGERPQAVLPRVPRRRRREAGAGRAGLTPEPGRPCARNRTPADTARRRSGTATTGRDRRAAPRRTSARRRPRHGPDRLA